MRRRGASLIWAIVVSMVFFTIAVTTSNFVIKESQMSVRIDDSAQAYAAAESGIEWGKYCISLPESECPDRTYESTELGNSTYIVTISGGRTKIESTGTSSGVNRKLDYTVTPNQALNDPGDLTRTLSVDGSYVQQFDYWTDGLTGGQIGIGNFDSSKAIYLEHKSSDNTISLVAKNGADTRNSISKVNTGSGFLNAGAYNIRVRIEYTQDLYAKMTIMARNADNTFTCISPILVLNLQGFITPADLTRFHFFNGGPVATNNIDNNGATYGDPSYYRLGTSNFFFDNMRTRGIPYLPTTVTVTAPAVGGQVELNPASAPYPAGTTLTISASPIPGYRFVQWTGTACNGATTNPCTMVVGATPITVAAQFEIQKYTLTAAVSGQRTGTITGRGTFDSGTVATLVATSDEAKRFPTATWSGDCTGVGTTIQVPMDRNKFCSVSFSN